MSKHLFMLALVLVVTAAPLWSAAESERVKVEPVLVVMDIQNIWLPRMAEEDRDAALDNTNKAIALFREFEYPVIAVYHSDPERGPEPGTEPFEFPPSIALAEGDARIVKSHASAFQETELTETLKELNCDAVFLCGLSATGCVLATYFGALERDLIPFMVEGTLLSPDASHTKFIEEICHSISLDELREAMKEE